MKTSSISADKRRLGTRTTAGIAAGVLAGVAAWLPVQAHHSFAMFDRTQTRVFTGVVTRVNPDVNHLQMFFAEMDAERTNVVRDASGQPIVWTVEMTSAAQAARQGITVHSFPPRTIISVALNPLRNGQPGGHRVGALFKCPADTPPAAGKHCDSVEGHEVFGDGGWPALEN